MRKYQNLELILVIICYNTQNALQFSSLITLVNFNNNTYCLLCGFPHVFWIHKLTQQTGLNLYCQEITAV